MGTRVSASSSGKVKFAVRRDYLKSELATEKTFKKWQEDSIFKTQNPDSKSDFKH